MKRFFLARLRPAALLLAVVLCLGLLAACADDSSSGTDASSAASQSGSSSASSTSGPEPAPTVEADLPEEIRAMWISYLEWQAMDLSTEEALRAAVGPMFDNCAAMGLNTVMAAVRPFSDALYKSDVYPWSHLLTGTQGQDPGYDPLAVLIEEAHARDLRLEAWFNPYRVNNASSGLEALAEQSPATLHPEWVREAGGTWFDPGLPEVQAMVVEGVREIVWNYEVDGIHIDDYFYPEFTAEQKAAGDDDAFDEEAYLEYGVGKALETWRRENVNTLIADIYAAIKELEPAMPFGISPQGNNENNYTMQYSDVKLWLAEPGYADYIMPQLYWGFGYRTSGGREDYAFENLCAEWAAYPRDGSVRLTAGLGAYRVGVGDGGANEQDEWDSGHNLADMVEALRTAGFTGFSLFRYDSLYGAEANEHAAVEITALTTLLSPPADGGDSSTSASSEADSSSASSSASSSSSAS